MCVCEENEQKKERKESRKSVFVDRKCTDAVAAFARGDHKNVRESPEKEKERDKFLLQSIIQHRQ